MQPVTPYTLSGQLGHCQVGSVWSAVDEQGRPLTVAVLDAAVAQDQRWRVAFAQTVNSLAQPGPDRPQYVRADVSAEVPWAAYSGAGGSGAGAERVFEALGMQVVAADPVQAVPAQREPADATAKIDRQQSAAWPSVPSGAWPTMPRPQEWNSGDNPTAVGPTSAAPDPTSGTPTSGTPMSGAPMSGSPYSPAAPDQYGLGYSPSPQDPFSGPMRRIEPSAPRRRRNGLWIGLAVLAVAVLAGAGTLFVLNRLDGNDPGPSQTRPAGTSQQAVALPTAPPASPGVEPPRRGGWPANWPRYTVWNTMSTLVLDGLGFPLKVPLGWQCALAGRAEGFVKYNCGTPPGAAQQFGGEIIVRNCAKPCDEKMQTELRKGEEAWGAQWLRTGPYSTLAETIVEENGEQRHGLVVVGFYRGSGDGEIDHQIVFRMTGPKEEAQQLRRVATYIRDTLLL